MMTPHMATTARRCTAAYSTAGSSSLNVEGMAAQVAPAAMTGHPMALPNGGKKTPMRIRPILAWYDLWVGVFIDRAKRRVYVFPLPCVGLVVSW